MSDHSAADTSLLRATRLLRAASQIEIDLDVATNLPQVLIQDTIRMLVWQAAVAQEIWNDVTYTPAQVQRVIEQMEELL